MAKRREAVDLTTDEDIDRALEEAKLHDDDPAARTVKYVAEHKLLIIGLNNGERLIVQTENVPVMRNAPAKQFAKWEILGLGDAVNFLDVDVALPVDGIIEGWYGPTRTVTAAAATMGRKGGSVTSEAKKASSRANGEKGGRPKKDFRFIDAYVGQSKNRPDHKIAASRSDRLRMTAARHSERLDAAAKTSKRVVADKTGEFNKRSDRAGAPKVTAKKLTRDR